MRESANIDCTRENGILITAANGLSRLVGKHTIISGLPEESAVHGGFMFHATTKEPYFVNASMGLSWYKRFLDLFVAGGNGAIVNLNKNDLDNQEIAIPSEREEQIIGNFFHELDNLITLHQRKFIYLLEENVLNKIKKTDSFYDYYVQCITVYKEGAIRKVTMDKCMLTLSWIKRLAPDLKICDISRITYQKLLNDYAKQHEKQITMDFHHQIKGACCIG